MPLIDRRILIHLFFFQEIAILPTSSIIFEEKERGLLFFQDLVMLPKSSLLLLIVILILLIFVSTFLKLHSKKQKNRQKSRFLQLIAGNPTTTRNERLARNLFGVNFFKSFYERICFEKYGCV